MDFQTSSDEKVNEAIRSFYELNGDTYDEKKRSFNSFLKQLPSSLNLDETKMFLDQLKPTTVYEQDLKLDILIYYGINYGMNIKELLDILKSGNARYIGKILKHWNVFENIFEFVTLEEFFDVFLPHLSHKMKFKVVNKISRMLKDEIFADKLFELLKERYGIQLACVVLQNCSMDLIKTTCEKHYLKLSSRCLLYIYTCDCNFIDYYFNLIERKGIKVCFNDYKGVIKRIAETDIDLFWYLTKKYKLPKFKFGKHTTKKVLVNKELLGEDKVSFHKREACKIAFKFGLFEKYLFNTSPDDLSSVLLPYATRPLMKTLPKSKRLYYLNELFKTKYNEEFINHCSKLPEDVLTMFAVNDLDLILKSLKGNDEFIYLNKTSESFPLFKEQLKSAFDPKTRIKLIILMLKSCKVNNDEKALLELLELFMKRYKNDTHLLNTFLTTFVVEWIEFDLLNAHHWKLLMDMLDYYEHSKTYFYRMDDYKRLYLTFLFKYDEMEPARNEFMQKFIADGLTSSGHFNWSIMPKERPLAKKFLLHFNEEMNKHQDDKNYAVTLVYLLEKIVIHHHDHPDDFDLNDFLYILILIDQDEDLMKKMYFSVNKILLYYVERVMDKSDVDFPCLSTFYSSNNLHVGYYKYCVKKNPRSFSMIANFYEKLAGIYKPYKLSLLDLLRCPYFNKNYYEAFVQHAKEDVLTSAPALFSIKFLVRTNNVDLSQIERFYPVGDGKIEPDTDKSFVAKQRSFIECLPEVPPPRNVEMISKFCVGDYLKFSLKSLYRIVYDCPEVYVDLYFDKSYDKAVSVRKHVLIIGRQILPVRKFETLLKLFSVHEKNDSLRSVLVKKSLEYFLQNVDEDFYKLFKDNLGKINKNDVVLYQYLMNYESIPLEFLNDYLQVIYNELSNNPNKEINRERMNLINNFDDHTIKILDVNFVKRCMDETLFTNVHLAVRAILLLKSDDIFSHFVEHLKSYFKKSESVRTNHLLTFITDFCARAIKTNDFNILKRFYDEFNDKKPNDAFMEEFLHLQFALLLIECKNTKGGKLNKKFADSIAANWKSFVQFYGFGLISLYVDVIQSFVSSCDDLDLIKFLYFLSQSLQGDEQILITSLLPTYVEEKRNSYFDATIAQLITNESRNFKISLDNYFLQLKKTFL